MSFILTRGTHKGADPTDTIRGFTDLGIMITQLLLSPGNGQNEVSKQKHTFSLILGSGALWAAVWSLLLILPHFEGTFRSPFWFFKATGQLQSGVTS